MNVRVLTPVNHKGRTVEVGEVIDLDDVAAKKLIKAKAVEEVKEITTTVEKQIEGTNNA